MSGGKKAQTPTSREAPNSKLQIEQGLGRFRETVWGGLMSLGMGDVMLATAKAKSDSVQRAGRVFQKRGK
jgi:hypothetical protein